MGRRFRHVDCKIPHDTFAGEIFDSRDIEKDELKRRPTHAKRKDEEEAGKSSADDPMDVDVPIDSPALVQIDGNGNQVVKAKHRCPSSKLEKNFERILRYYATHPWAEVIHLLNATTNFTTMACSIRLPVHAHGAPSWPPVTITNEDFSRNEVLQARCGFGCRGAIKSAGRQARGPDNVVTALRSFYLCFFTRCAASARSLLLLLIPLSASRRVTWIEEDYVEKSEVGPSHEK